MWAKAACAYASPEPQARAQIKKVNTSKSLKAPGVVAVLTGQDLANDKIGGLIAGWKIVSEDGTDMKVPAHPALATETVNYVGDHVAVVIAETLDEARNAADAVKVDYKVLKAVVDTDSAIDSEAIGLAVLIWSITMQFNIDCCLSVNTIARV